MDVGDKQSLKFRITDPVTGDPLDATVALEVTDPSGNVSTPSVAHTATGEYDSSFLLDEAGVWYYTWEASGTLTDVQSGQIDVYANAPISYVSLAEFKTARGNLVDNPDVDAGMQNAIDGASRMIDRRCSVEPGGFALARTATIRTYGLANRLYRDEDGTWLIVDPIGTLNALVVESATGTTIAAADYVLAPYNALATGRPVTRIRLVSGSWSSPRITARFGYPFIPDEIRQATLILATRLFLRREKDESGRNQDGSFQNQVVDPDVDNLIDPFVKPGIW